MAEAGNTRCVKIPLVIRRIHLDPKRRILAISDIHGNADGFQRLLNRVALQPDDQLLIVGDMVEKGPDSLRVVEMVRQLAETMDVYAVRGNCEQWIAGLFSDRQAVWEHIHSRKHSLFQDMINRLALDVTDWDATYTALQDRFGDLMAWLGNLPIVIEDDHILVAHAGIMNPCLEENDGASCMRQDAYEQSAPPLFKPILVGHWPTVNYCTSIPDCGPRYRRGVLSIDGGNQVKPDGQLNLVVFDDICTMRFSWLSDEEGRLWTADHDQSGSEHSRCINWCDNRVIVLEQTAGHCYVEHVSSGYRMWIHAEDLFQDEDGYRVYDVTDYHLPIRAGDAVYVYKETANSYYVKKNGILGWYHK